MEARITGTAELRKLAAKLRAAGRTDLERQLRRGLEVAVKPTSQEVHAGLGRHIPSGFVGELGSDLRIVPQFRGRSGSVSIRATAKGRKEKRDLSAMDRGILRHPVHGRTRKLWHHAKHRATSKPNPWVAQRIPPGFFAKPAEKTKDRAVKEVTAALDRVAEQIEKG